MTLISILFHQNGCLLSNWDSTDGFSSRSRPLPFRRLLEEMRCWENHIGSVRSRRRDVCSELRGEMDGCKFRSAKALGGAPGAMIDFPDLGLNEES